MQQAACKYIEQGQGVTLAEHMPSRSAHGICSSDARYMAELSTVSSFAVLAVSSFPAQTSVFVSACFTCRNMQQAPEQSYSVRQVCELMDRHSSWLSGGCTHSSWILPGGWCLAPGGRNYPPHRPRHRHRSLQRRAAPRPAWLHPRLPAPRCPAPPQLPGPACPAAPGQISAPTCM